MAVEEMSSIYRSVRRKLWLSSNDTQLETTSLFFKILCTVNWKCSPVFLPSSCSESVFIISPPTVLNM